MQKNLSLFSKAAQARIDELCELTAELYQVIGILADEAGRFEDEKVQKALDNATQHHFVHTDVLPFPVIDKAEEYRRDSERYKYILAKYPIEILQVLGAGANKPWHTQKSYIDEAIDRRMFIDKVDTIDQELHNQGKI